MSGTPQVIVEAFDTNAGRNSKHARVVELSDGTFMAAFSVPVGNGLFEVFGQRFNADGELVGNITKFTQGFRIPDGEFDITALSNNKFVVGFAVGAGEGSPLLDNIVVRGFETKVGGGVKRVSDLDITERHGDGASDLFGSPTLTATGENEYSMQFLLSGAFPKLFEINKSPGSKSVETKHLDTFSGNRDAEVDSATLENGSTVYVLDRNGEDRSGTLKFRVTQPDGTVVRAYGEAGLSDKDIFDPYVTALKGGGFVISWALEFRGGSQPIFFQMFDKNGVRETDMVRVSAPGIQRDDNPAIAALGGMVRLLRIFRQNARLQLRRFLFADPGQL